MDINIPALFMEVLSILSLSIASGCCSRERGRKSKSKVKGSKYILVDTNVARESVTISG